jgi:heat shock protein HslJ
MKQLLVRAAHNGRVRLTTCLLAAAVLLWFIFFAPSPAVLQNRLWQLETAQTLDGTVLWTTTPGHFTMTFHDHTIKGRGACNTFDGQVRVTRLINGLSFNWVFITLMNCLLPANITSESAFLRALNSATKYEIRADKLYVYYDASTKVLIFK